MQPGVLGLMGYYQVMSKPSRRGSAMGRRVRVTLDSSAYAGVQTLARHAGVSVSRQVRELVAVALDSIEDAGLEALAHDRLSDVSGRVWVSHDEVLRRLGISERRRS